MKRHVLAHGEKKCLTCGMCDRMFSSEEGLNKHLRRAHLEDEDLFECGYCQKK